MALVKGVATRRREASALRALQAAAASGATGAVEIVDRAHGSAGRIWFYEGRPYAASLTGYPVPVGARLASAGALDGGTVLESDEIGMIAVERGLVDVEALGTMHQEFMLATSGALLAVPDADARTLDGEVTGTACCIPVELEAVLDAIALRTERMQSGWMQIQEVLAGAVVGLTIDSPATLVLATTGASVPAALQIPEVRAFLTACDGARTLDEIAWAGGFTRAEAVHLARALATQGLIGPVGRRPLESPCRRLDVPEQFPRSLLPSEPAPRSATVVEAHAIADSAIADRAIADREAGDSPTEDSVDAEGAGAERVPGGVSVAPAAEMVRGTASEDETSRAFRIAALQAELASAERWVAEVRDRLRRARDDDGQAAP